MTKERRKTPPSPPAPKHVREHVADLVERKGIVDAASDLGIGREAVTRIVGGLGVRAGTVAQVQAKIERGGS
jgi:hypothetical protein